jgi:hypothetical protein
MARNVVRKGIELDKDDVRWFNEQYPEGSLSGIISMLFSKFREANTHTPSDYAEIAARTLSEELNSK